MSLRDQLMKSGLVSKKRAQKLDREQKQDRKKSKGQKKSKKQQRREAEAAQRQAEVQRAEDLAARGARRKEADRYERALNRRKLVLKCILKGAGKIQFHHKDRSGAFLKMMRVNARLAGQLQRGSAGIIALSVPKGLAYVPVSRSAIDVLLKESPEDVVFFVRDTSDLGSPENGFSPRDWPPDFRAHRREGRGF